MTIAAFTFGFYFIFGLDDIENPLDFWHTILLSFELFVTGGTDDETTVGAIFTIILTVVGMLILTNLLIALMSSEYEKFQETAQEEVSFMYIETVIDLAHRDRLMPPPLNVFIYPLGLIIHILNTLCALLSVCNLYSRINRETYLFLSLCYCGCNRQIKEKNERKREQLTEDEVDDEEKIQKKLYEGRLFLFLQLTGFMYLYNKSSYLFQKKCGFLLVFLQRCRCKCCRKKKCCQMLDMRNKKARKKYKSNPLVTYHKGCYSPIKLRVNDKLKEGEETSTIRGIAMKKYIEKFERINQTTLHLDDKILIKHLTVDTLLCKHCYQPYIEEQVDKSLLSPFRVLLDFISCFVFLFTAWIPLICFFVIMVFIEYLQECLNPTLTSRRSNDRNRIYEEFDREYFPHPEKEELMYAEKMNIN